jgi:hypothetical protein
MESAGTISESGVMSPRASIEDLSATEIAQREMEMLLAVPDAAPIGNMSLHGVLGETWSDDLYWAIRNRLVERGLLEKGRGKGGSVKKVPVAGDAGEEIPFAVETLSAIASEGLVPPTEASSSGVRYSRELDLYEPVALVLRSQWAKEQGFDNFRVEVTARQGSRSTGGKWTRPDIAVVGYRTFPYLPGRIFEVVTFELKPTDSIDVAAVYEALAHRRASTRAYVVAHVPSSKREDYEAVIDAMAEEAKKFGIGIIVVEDPEIFNSWETLLDADRFDPDPERLNEFIAQQTSTELKDQIVRWFK